MFFEPHEFFNRSFLVQEDHYEFLTKAEYQLSKYDIVRPVQILQHNPAPPAYITNIRNIITFIE